MRQRACSWGETNEVEALAPRLVKIQWQPGKPGRWLAESIIGTQRGPARIDDHALLVQDVGLHRGFSFLGGRAFWNGHRSAVLINRYMASSTFVISDFNTLSGMKKTPVFTISIIVCLSIPYEQPMSALCALKVPLLHSWLV
jgi:hypothetical protein